MPTVSEDLRAAERDIDNHHRRNPLCQQRFATAAWCFLAAVEERIVREIVRSSQQTGTRTAHEYAALSDQVIVNTKWPMRWLVKACRAGGPIPRSFDEKDYEAATNLYDLGLQFISFESAFTFASIGAISLTLDGDRIRASDELRRDTRFDAYDRLRQPHSSDADIEGLDDLLTAIARSVGMRGEWFYYDTGPRLIDQALDVLAPLVEARFGLPDYWTFPQFSLLQFRATAAVLFAIAYIHFNARLMAASAGCVGLGYARALYIATERELLNTLKAHARVPHGVAAAIVDVLTLGHRAQKDLDPALQPLIPLTSTHLAISPALILNSSLERNFAVLLNRLPEEKAAYAKLSRDRETTSRERVENAVEALGFRCWHGEVSEWGESAEIDLVITSDRELVCLVLELKAFVGPADPREVHERSLEIQKGIQQIRDRRICFAVEPTPFHAAIKIDDRYRVTWTVASESSIGAAYVQAPDVPVVQTSHLIDKLTTKAELREICNWLEAFEHLPVEGVHYDTVDTTSSVGPWTLDWYGIRGLVDRYL